MAQSKVAVGKTTVAGGAVTVAAYAVAIVAFVQGARDEATMSALIVGTLSLLTTLGGRYAQAVVQILAGWKNAPPAASPPRVPSEKEISSWSAAASSSPRPMVDVSREIPGGGVPPEIAS